MTRHSAEIEATIAELEHYGAQVTSIANGGKHKRVYYHYQGRDRYMVCAGTGSDHRGPENARQAVRRALDIKRGKTVGERRVRKDTVAESRAALPERLTAGRNPWAALQGTALAQAASALAADRAWLSFFGWTLVDHQHNPVNPRIREAMGL